MRRLLFRCLNEDCRVVYFAHGDYEMCPGCGRPGVPIPVVRPLVER